MKLLILTIDANTLNWKTLPAKLAAITAGLNATPNAVWEVSVVHRPLVPKVIDGRIAHEWFNSISYPLFRQGFDLVAIHMSDKQRTVWGIQPSLRGANQIDTDFVGESYFWADEGTRRGRHNQFIQTCLHECSHELARATRTQDLTHAYHDANGDVSGIFSSYDMAKWQPVYQAQVKTVVSLIEHLRSLLYKKKASTLLHPVPEKYRKLISQAYGLKSARYPRTGHHIGTDYALPVGTPLVAPWDAEVTTVGTHPELGNYCHLSYTFQGESWEERWCHLDRVPAIGRYSRGRVVAYSGNTGQTTGPHLHREVHRDDVRVDLITRANWSQMTIDPEANQ